MFITVLSSLLLGMIAGFFAGLFGIGGGLIMVPILVWLFSYLMIAKELIMLMAIATSLATISLTALAASYGHYRQARLLWDYIARLTPGIIIGSISGAFIAQQMSADQLKLIFASFLIVIGIQLWRSAPLSSPIYLISKNWDYLIGLMIGSISAILGIGGGTLTVPYLIKRGVTIHQSVAISSACGFPIAIAGSLSFIQLGWHHPQLPIYSFGYIYLPAFIAMAIGSLFTAALGAKCAHYLPAAQLKRYFSIVIFIMAIKLFHF
ncbi:MAG: hypothetical protein RL637_1695 [Pseudomonadota bacterium]|jgi:uncharacterized membrane protein YfcA